VRQQKHQMGVEVPSFFEWQRKKQEQEQDAAAAASRQARKPGFFDAIFLPPGRPAQTPPPAAPNPVPSGFPNQPMAFTIDIPMIWSQVISWITEYGNQQFILDVLTNPVYNATRIERDQQAADEIASFFGLRPRIPGASIQQYWQNVIGPFFTALEKSINDAKPLESLGFIRFELEPNTNQLLMAYRYQ